MSTERQNETVRFSVVYLLDAATSQDAESKARGICWEQTVELSESLVTDDRIRDSVVGKIQSRLPLLLNRGQYEVEISYPVATTALELTQFLNVVFGNISIQPGIFVKDLFLPQEFLSKFKGPRFGIEGLRSLLDVHDRPILSTALKPMGNSPEELAEMAYLCVIGGIDIIKDDHGLTDQSYASFEKRVLLCAAAVARANKEISSKSIYVANVTAPHHEIMRRALYAKKCGAGGLLICPMIVGLDAMRHLADCDEIGLPVLSHPSFMGSYCLSRTNGIYHRVLFGQLQRLFGADAVIFPNYGGRFTFSQDECKEIVHGLSQDMLHLRRSFPAPGGGMNLSRIADICAFYGLDVMFLIGGALLADGALAKNSRDFREKVEEWRSCTRGEEKYSRIERVAAGIRRQVLEYVIKNGGGYLSQACSSAEILATLYEGVMNLGRLDGPLKPSPFKGVPSSLNPEASSCLGCVYNGPKGPGFDRLIFSPSQYSLVLYATLIEVDRLAKDALDEFNLDGSTLEMIGAQHSPGNEVMTGSLGQGISQAAGIAMARKRRGDLGRVVMFMSDGETWEAVQAMVFHRLGNMLIYVDINGFQCDGPVSQVMNIEPLDMRLRAFNANVHVVKDGHDIAELVRCGQPSSAVPDRPTFVLCYTCPWRGMDWLSSRTKFHYVRFGSEEEREEFRKHLARMQPQVEARDMQMGPSPPMNPTVPISVKSCMVMEKRVHANKLVQWAADRPNVVVLSADLTSSTEIDIFKEKYPERFFSMGIAEQNMLSFAGGLAREGYIPLVHTFGVFIYRRAFDQISMSIAYPNLPVRMFGFLPGINAPGGATHQAIEDVAVMRALPNMTVIDCGDATEAESVLEAIEHLKGPVYVRQLRGEVPRLFPASEVLCVGRCRVLFGKDGADILVISSNVCTEEAMRAISALARCEVSLHLIHVSTLKPFDDDLVVRALQGVRLGVVTMENHTVIGGLGSAVAELMAQHGISVKLKKLGLQDTFAHGATRRYLMQENGMDAMGLVRSIESILGKTLDIQESDLEAVRIEPQPALV